MRIGIVGCGTSTIGFMEQMVKDQIQGVHVDVFDQGMSPDKRVPSGKGSIYGFGGAGTYSDGKLSVSDEIGGEIAAYLGKTTYQKLLAPAIDLWTLDRRLDRIEESKIGDDPKLTGIIESFFKNNLSLVLSDFIHVGTDNLQTVNQELFDRYHDDALRRFHMHFEKEIKEVVFPDQHPYYQLRFSDGSLSDPYDSIILATGRGGSNLVKDVLSKRQIPFSGTKVDIGIRYEVSHQVTRDVTDVLYEFKVKYLSKSDDEVRTFCVNPQGLVSREEGNDFVTVNGHSFVHKKTHNTNFAILVTHNFTYPFNDPNTYGLSVIRLANKLAGDKGIIIQRFKDFKVGRRSTVQRISKSYIQPTLDATPGDLNLVLPRRTAFAIEEFIETLNLAMPGMNNPGNLLYGVEAKFYSLKPQYDEPFQLPGERIYVMGDASGYTRGIVQSTMSGMYLAQALFASDQA